ncbi:MAG: ATP synthase subunit I [Desulfobacteraceae bacterium]|nr:ATP synthase subunit I [Desulfobacteraceae bacterium]
MKTKITRMEEIRKVQKRYCSIAITFAIFAGIIFFLFGLKPIGKGLILGTIFSIINFILMGETLPLKIGISRNRAGVYSFLSILSRYALLAIPLVLSIKLARFNIGATVCGLFMVQLVILTDEILHQFYFSNRKDLFFKPKKNRTKKLLWKN